MDNIQKIYIDMNDKDTAQALATAVPQYRACDIVAERSAADIVITDLSDTDSGDGCYALRLTVPFRLGEVLDRLSNIDVEQGNNDLILGPYVLDADAMSIARDGNIVRLTEKERDIIVRLHKVQGEKVSRELLLSDVWAYAENVETHTLETHIYRLRQKIEQDPSSPELIITDDDGYKLGF